MSYLSDADVISALKFAVVAHDGQWRKGAKTVKKPPPYVTHCIDVMNALLQHGGGATPEQLIVALLHDTIEDTEVNYDVLRARFGKRIADDVELLTLPKDILAGEDYAEKKHEYQLHSLTRMDPGVRLVKFADKTCNIKDLVEVPPDWSTQHIISYGKKAHSLCARVMDMDHVPQTMVQFHESIWEDFQDKYM